jgi:hypothetical protein
MVRSAKAPAPLHGHARINLRSHEADARRQQGEVDQRKKQDRARFMLFERVEDRAIPQIHAVRYGKIENDCKKDPGRQEP